MSESLTIIKIGGSSSKNYIKIIEEIDSLGGSIPSIESGWMQNEIARSSYKYQKEIALTNKQKYDKGVSCENKKL